MLILAILRHALNDPHFKVYHDRWMLEGTLTALLNEFYKIPESLQFSVVDLKSALSRSNHTQLSKYGFETKTLEFCVIAEFATYFFRWGVEIQSYGKFWQFYMFFPPEPSRSLSGDGACSFKFASCPLS